MAPRPCARHGRRFRRGGLAAVIVLGLSLTCKALGQDRAVESPSTERAEEFDAWINKPVDASRAEEMATLIDQLGSPTYGERVDATALLTESGPEALEMLRRAFVEREEFEVRLRIEQIVHEIYMRHHVYDQNGFLGISQNLIPKEHADDSRIPVNHIGIEVSRVLPGTAAEAAQLKPGDVIVALDGESLTGNGREGVMEFGESIRVRGPGTRVAISVLRGPKELEFEVVLGSRPKMYYNVTQGPVYEMFEGARLGFERFWETHFQQQDR